MRADATAARGIALAAAAVGVSDESEMDSLIGIRILAGCAPAFNVRSDYNGTTDSSRYRTVFISSGHSTGNPVMDQLIAEDAGIALRRRGCQLRSDSQADECDRGRKRSHA